MCIGVNKWVIFLDALVDMVIALQQFWYGSSVELWTSEEMLNIKWVTLNTNFLANKGKVDVKRRQFYTDGKFTFMLEKAYLIWHYPDHVFSACLGLTESK